MKILNIILCFLFCLTLNGCGFHLQKNESFSKLANPLYISASDPYSDTAEYLKTLLQASQNTIVEEPTQASYILDILDDQASQNLVGVSSSQTRSYNLSVNITVQLRSRSGEIILPPLILTETRSIITQSSSVMSGSAEINLLYQTMRHSAIHALLHRLNSREIEKKLTAAKIQNKLDTYDTSPQKSIKKINRDSFHPESKPS